MSRDRPGPAADRLLVARLDSIAGRHARGSSLTEDETAAVVADVGEVACDRADLLAEVAGLAIGTPESRGPGYVTRGPGYVTRGQAAAEPCRLTGADEEAIPAWIEEGRRRAESRQHPPLPANPAYTLASLNASGRVNEFPVGRRIERTGNCQHRWAAQRGRRRIGWRDAAR